MLFTCFDLVEADVVMEIAWRKGLMDFAMPFMVQTIKNYETRISALENKFAVADEEVKEKVEAERQAEVERHQQEATYLHNPGFMNPMMIPLSLPTPQSAHGYAGGY